MEKLYNNIILADDFADKDGDFGGAHAAGVVK